MKWNADIIRSKEDGSYRAVLSFDDKADRDFFGNDWKKLCSAVRKETGICFPMRKCFKFETLSAWEQISGIDASHTRKSCIVTMGDRKAGWKRYAF